MDVEGFSVDSVLMESPEGVVDISLGESILVKIDFGVEERCDEI